MSQSHPTNGQSFDQALESDAPALDDVAQSTLSDMGDALADPKRDDTW